MMHGRDSAWNESSSNLLLPCVIHRFREPIPAVWPHLLDWPMAYFLRG
jgi:hypothetical protein